MNISELNQKYTNGELSSTKGDKEFRYYALSPLFKNLFENKVVYHERHTFIIKLEDIIITPDEFSATAVQHLLIKSMQRARRPFPEKWTVGANWSYLRLSGNCLTPYSGWCMWVDPILVEKVEKLVIDQKIKEALDLTLYSES